MKIGEKYSRKKCFETEKYLGDFEPDAQHPVGLLLLEKLAVRHVAGAVFGEDGKRLLVLGVVRDPHAELRVHAWIPGDTFPRLEIRGPKELGMIVRPPA